MSLKYIGLCKARKLNESLNDFARLRSLYLPSIFRYLGNALEKALKVYSSSMRGECYGLSSQYQFQYEQTLQPK